MKMLPFAVLHPAPLRGIRPAGWLQDFLERQSNGLTGNVAVSGYPYGYKFWGSQRGRYQRLVSPPGGPMNRPPTGSTGR